jgi:hypothetical protein
MHRQPGSISYLLLDNPPVQHDSFSNFLNSTSFQSWKLQLLFRGDHEDFHQEEKAIFRGCEERRGGGCLQDGHRCGNRKLARCYINAIGPVHRNKTNLAQPKEVRPATTNTGSGGSNPVLVSISKILQVATAKGHGWHPSASLDARTRFSSIGI